MVILEGARKAWWLYVSTSLLRPPGSAGASSGQRSPEL